MKRYATEIGVVTEGNALLIGLVPMDDGKQVVELSIGETGIYTKHVQHHKITHIAVTRIEDGE